jgi:nucleotide-binding universal stress UspA family protein
MRTNPRQILVATDFSSGSDDAFAAAIDFARQTGAALELVHVCEARASSTPFGLTYYDRAGELTAYGRLELARRAKSATDAGVVARTKVLDGSPAIAILRHAQEIDADLVVLGTHGRRGPAPTVLGSVAERVVKRAKCAVLTVPFTNKAA